jgi:hypothetical protein
MDFVFTNKFPISIFVSKISSRKICYIKPEDKVSFCLFAKKTIKLPEDVKNIQILLSSVLMTANVLDLLVHIE